MYWSKAKGSEFWEGWQFQRPLGPQGKASGYDSSKVPRLLGWQGQGFIQSLYPGVFQRGFKAAGRI